MILSLLWFEIKRVPSALIQFVFAAGLLSFELTFCYTGK